MTKRRITIDRGNTALKAAVWDCDNRIKAEVTLPGNAHMQTALERLGIINTLAGTTAGYSSVVREYTDADIAFLQACGKVYNVKNPAIKLPFQTDYRTPHTLGADRIAAMAGATALAPAVHSILVVDLGTAATFDMLLCDNGIHTFVGGNIAPGVPLRLRSLHEHTSALPDVSADHPMDSRPWGKDTNDAMLRGAVFGVLAELEFYLAQAPEGTVPVLTGGGSKYLRDNNLISFNHIYDPDLVMVGLNSIIDYNENS